MARLITNLLLLSIFMLSSSCTGDPCKKRDCDNCVLGECLCEGASEGCYGENCEICPESVLILPDPIVNLCPTQIYGDRKLEGDTVYCSVRAELLMLSPNVVGLEVFYRVEEMEIDFSAAEILIETITYQLPEGYQISSLGEESKFSGIFEETDEFVNIIQPTKGLVKRIEMFSKTPGDDLGGCESGYAMVNIFFRGIEIEIIKMK